MHMQMNELIIIASLLAVYFVHKILKILTFCPNFPHIKIGVNIILHLFREKLRHIPIAEI